MSSSKQPKPTLLRSSIILYRQDAWFALQLATRIGNADASPIEQIDASRKGIKEDAAKVDYGRNSGDLVGRRHP